MHKSKASHNIVEKNRRAHLKSCFEVLKHNIPSLNGHKGDACGLCLTFFRNTIIINSIDRQHPAGSVHIYQAVGGNHRK
jgi:hypothetical protein